MVKNYIYATIIYSLLMLLWDYADDKDFVSTKVWILFFIRGILFYILLFIVNKLEKSKN